MVARAAQCCARSLTMRCRQVRPAISTVIGSPKRDAAMKKKGRACRDDVTAFIEVRLTPERGGGFDRLARRIARFEQVTSCYLISGGYDLLVMVEGRDLLGVAGFVSEKLSTVEGVVSTATHFRLKSYKEKGFLFGESEEVNRLPVTP